MVDLVEIRMLACHYEPSVDIKNLIDQRKLAIKRHGVTNVTLHAKIQLEQSLDAYRLQLHYI